jgi:hypothetical protein
MTAEERSERDVSVKVRRRDYDATRATVSDLPITFLDVFTAMRLHWERLSDKQRLDAIRRSRRELATV